MEAREPESRGKGLTKNSHMSIVDEGLKGGGDRVTAREIEWELEIGGLGDGVGEKE